jgi:hypothetical protein
MPDSRRQRWQYATFDGNRKGQKGREAGDGRRETGSGKREAGSGKREAGSGRGKILGMLISLRERGIPRVLRFLPVSR